MQEAQSFVPPTVPPLPSPPQRYDFRFTGKAGEYFRIWIVNLALSILTLGIYSAWAKVRTARYFYANTQVAGSPFEYLGQPLAVLRGRLVGALILLLYGVAGRVSPLLSGLFGLAMFVLLPFLVVLTMRFRLRMSSWRGVRFAFDGGMAEAASKYILLPIVGFLSAGLLLPFAQYKQKAFLVDNSRFGTTPFRHRFRARQFYMLYLKGFGLIVLNIVAAMVIIAATGAMVAKSGLGKSAGAVFAFVPTVIIFPLYLFTLSYFLVRLHNLVWNHLQLGEHRFESRLSVRRMCWLYCSNALAVACTLGLAYPWAKIRLARYQAESTTLIAADSLDSFQQGAGSDVSAVGDQVSNVLDLDLGL